MNKNNKNNSGFTLIETLVVLGVFTFALGAVTSFLIYAYKAGNDLGEVIDVIGKGLIALTEYRVEHGMERPRLYGFGDESRRTASLGFGCLAP